MKNVHHLQETITSPDLQEQLNRRFDQCQGCLKEATLEFMNLDGVIGVGYGPKEKNEQILENEPSIIIYTREKKPESQVTSGEMIPAEFNGVVTDVVVPGNRATPFYNDYDSRWIEWGVMHEGNPYKDVNIEPMVGYNLDNIAVLEIDNTFMNGNTVDWAKATKRFLQSYPDKFDFITFYVDTSAGIPSQGSWHRGVYNKTTGINYYAGANLDSRAAYGSTKLQAIHSISFFGNYVLLQETGHMWGAFTRNRDTQTGANRYDLLISDSGQGLFHWGRYFDNNHSPMDYDGVDWQALGGNQFQAHGVGDDYFHFHPLDLYLMGLIPATSVGSFYTIQSPSGNNGTITGNRKNIGVKNVIWAEGNRNPAYPNTQKIWKQACVVLTFNARASRTFAQQVATQRRKFTWQFYKATRFLGKVDTTLKATTLFPTIRDISISIDNDRAFIGWKTNVSTKGKVNYSTSASDFRRDQAHGEPFMTKSENSFSTSHGVVITGLSADTTYHFEIVTESKEGLVDRKGVERFYTRKTNDTCEPDINNVSLKRISFFRTNKIAVSWKTDELCDSRVRYGNSTPPTVQKYDPYPTNNHSMTLTGLRPGTYFVRIESRDAAGNLAIDDNNGSYYQISIPVAAPSGLESVDSEEILVITDKINASVDAGNMEDAIDRTSNFILDVGIKELQKLAEKESLPEDELSASYELVCKLAQTLGSNAKLTSETSETIEFSFDQDPLCCISCINLPVDTVAQECGFPVLADMMASVCPSICLEPNVEQGTGCYRLKKVSSS